MLCSFDVVLQLGANSGRLHYNSALFIPDTMQRMAGHLVVLLDSAVQRLDESIMRLSLISTSERDQVCQQDDSCTHLAPA